ERLKRTTHLKKQKNQVRRKNNLLKKKQQKNDQQKRKQQKNDQQKRKQQKNEHLSHQQRNKPLNRQQKKKQANLLHNNEVLKKIQNNALPKIIIQIQKIVHNHQRMIKIEACYFERSALYFYSSPLLLIQYSRLKHNDVSAFLCDLGNKCKAPTPLK